MTKAEYEQAMLALANIIKRPPLLPEQKAVLVELMKADKNFTIQPATDEEIKAVINFLNNTPDTSDVTLGIRRYKNVVLCPTYEDRTKYQILTYDEDEQLNDLVEYMRDLSETEYISKSFNRIYTVKKY